MSYERRRPSPNEGMFEAFRSLVEQNQMARFVTSPRVFQDIREIEIYSMINGEDYLSEDHPFFPVLMKALMDRYGEDLITDLRQVFSPESRVGILVAPMKKELPTSQEKKDISDDDVEDEDEDEDWEDDLDDNDDT